MPIALEWIRESDERVIFWGRVEFELAKFDTTPKGRDGMDNRIARVVEPSTAEEAAAVNRNPDHLEYRNARLEAVEAVKLREELLTERTPETEARYNEALDRVERLLFKHSEKMKK